MKKTIIIGLLFMLAACSGQSTPTPTITPDATAEAVTTAEATNIPPESTVDPERTTESAATLEVTVEVTAEAVLPTADAQTALTDEIEGEISQGTQETVSTEEVVSEDAQSAENENLNVEAQTPAEICAANLPAAEPATREYSEPQQVLEAEVDYRAILCTDVGAVYVDLFEEYAPVTVNNFVFLAENDYYNNTIFHRVIEDFMAQGGDPTATGSGGPGYQFIDEFVGFLTFDRPNLLAMANANNMSAGIMGTNGSQFFITTVPTPHLNFNHTIFGEVLEGQDIVDAIQIRDPQQADSPATQLQKVIVVTDPESVTAGYEIPALASAEEVLAAFDAFRAVVPPDLTFVTNEQINDLDTTVSNAAETVEPQYRNFLTENNFEYSIDSSISNNNCTLETYVFTGTSYQLLAFASKEDASSALNDDFLGQLAEAEGYEPSDLTTLGQPVYVRSEQTCDTQVRSGLVFAQRGRFIAVLRATIPAESSFDVDTVLDQLVARNYELSLADVLRREVTN